jgi:hypothetical protein
MQVERGCHQNIDVLGYHLAGESDPDLLYQVEIPCRSERSSVGENGGGWSVEDGTASDIRLSVRNFGFIEPMRG